MISRRDRRHEQTREEILAAAEDLVLAGDPGSFTVQAVARAVGVTPGALYRYFPSHGAILAAVQGRVIADLVAAIDAEVGRAADPLARVYAVGHAVLAFAADAPHRYALLSGMLAVPRPLLGDGDAAPTLALVLRAVGRIEALFADARAAGALGPGDDRSRLLVLWAAVHGAVQLDKLSRFAAVNTTTIGADALEAVLVSWGADREAVRRIRGLGETPVRSVA